MTETDPNGKAPNEAGAKLDSRNDAWKERVMSEQPPIETIARWFYDWELETKKFGDVVTVDKYYTWISCALGREFMDKVTRIRAQHALSRVRPVSPTPEEVLACQKWFVEAEAKYLDEHGVHTSDDILVGWPKSRHLECLEKHLAYAEVLESESRSGYPANRRLVIGNLVAAEEHAKEDGEVALAETLRQSRRAYQSDGPAIDFQGLFDLLRSAYVKV